MHVLLDDDQGRLALRRLWPWQRLLARGAAGRLDRALAEGASPLYRDAGRDDLAVLAGQAADALTW